MATCPQCGAEGIHDYCHNCDKPLSAMETDETDSLGELIAQRIYRGRCPECDAMFDLSQSKCPECGTEVSLDDVDTAGWLPSNLAASTSALVGFVLGAGVGLVLYEGGGPILISLILLNNIPGLQDLLGGLVFSRTVWILVGGFVGGTNAWDLTNSA